MLFNYVICFSFDKISFFVISYVIYFYLIKYFFLNLNFFFFSLIKHNEFRHEINVGYTLMIKKTMIFVIFLPIIEINRKLTTILDYLHTIWPLFCFVLYTWPLNFNSNWYYMPNIIMKFSKDFSCDLLKIRIYFLSDLQLFCDNFSYI